MCHIFILFLVFGYPDETLSWVFHMVTSNFKTLMVDMIQVVNFSMLVCWHWYYNPSHLGFSKNPSHFIKILDLRKNYCWKHVTSLNKQSGIWTSLFLAQNDLLKACPEWCQTLPRLPPPQNKNRTLDLWLKKLDFVPGKQWIHNITTVRTFHCWWYDFIEM